MTAVTFAEALGKHGITIPDHLVADAEVPVLTGHQAQGDVGIRPTGKPILTGHKPVPREGVQVVRGEATGNTHWLDSDSGALWAFAPETDPSVSTLIGELIVPEGGTAYLTHTSEHGSNAVGAGTYRLSGKRTQSDVIERVYD